MNNLEIAHIKAAEKNGPRWDASMTDEDRAHFDNLIFLCKPHHKMIDKIAPNDFPVTILQEWKKKREQDAAAGLRGLRQLTEEGLQQIIADVVRARDEELQDAIDRFAQVDSQAASVLQGLVDELHFLQRRPLLDEDLINSLHSASRNLHHLNEDNVNSLLNASHRLRGVNEDTVNQLHSAAESLRNLGLEDMVSQLHEAARALRRARPE